MKVACIEYIIHGKHRVIFLLSLPSLIAKTRSLVDNLMMSSHKETLAVGSRRNIIRSIIKV